MRASVPCVVHFKFCATRGTDSDSISRTSLFNRFFDLLRISLKWLQRFPCNYKSIIVMVINNFYLEYFAVQSELRRTGVASI